MTDTLSPRALLITSREDAAREMLKIGVCAGGVDAMEGKTRTLIVKVSDASIPAAHVLKQQMLSLGGDAAVAKDVITHAVDSSDVLLMGTATADARPHQKARPGSRSGFPSSGSASSRCSTRSRVRGRRCFARGPYTLDLSERVHVMGILNVTPDSFSDGGQYLRPTAALDRALRHDRGGRRHHRRRRAVRRGRGRGPSARTRSWSAWCPSSESCAEEWDGPVSVDTYRARVAERVTRGRRLDRQRHHGPDGGTRHGRGDRRGAEPPAC